MWIRSYRPWIDVGLPAHHEVVRAVSRYSWSVLGAALSHVQSVAELLNEHLNNDSTLKSLKLEMQHQALSERALLTLQLMSQGMDALIGSRAHGPRLALQISASPFRDGWASGQVLAQDLAKVAASMQRALRVRRICEASEGPIEFLEEFSSESNPRFRVSFAHFQNAILVFPQLYLMLTKQLRENVTICRRLVAANPFVLAFFSDELLNNEALVQSVVQDCAEPGQAPRLPRILAMLPQRWKQHPELATLCVRIWWACLPQIGESLLGNRDWVASILPAEGAEDEDQLSISFGVASEIRTQLVTLRAELDHEDESYLLKLAGQRAQAWAALPEALRARKEAASLLLQSDFSLVWDHEQIALLSNPLRCDKQLAHAFMKVGAPLRAWDESLWLDPELAALDLLSADSEEVHLNIALAGDRNLALEVVNKRPELLCEFLPEVRQDPEVMTLALTNSHSVLELASDSQRANMFLIEPAVRAWGLQAFRLAGAVLRCKETGSEAAVLLRQLLSRPEAGLALSLAADDALRYDPALRALARDKPEGFEPKQYALFRRDTPFNHERWRDLIEMDWMSFAWSPDWVRRDRTLVLLAVRLCLHANGVDRDGGRQLLTPTDLCHPDLQAEPTLWKEVLTEFASAERAETLWNMLMVSPEAVRNDPDLLVILLQVAPIFWKRLAREVRRHHRLVDAMIPLAPELVAQEFYDDESIMQKCCEQHFPCFRLASQRLRSPGPFASEWCSKKPCLFHHLTLEARSDLATVRHALSYDWMILAHTSESVRGNPEIIQLGMRQHPAALAYASASLREDPAFLMDCLRKGLSLAISMEDRLADGVLATHYEAALRFSRTAESPEFWIVVIRELGPSCLSQAPVALHRHAGLMREAIAMDRSMLEIVSPMLTADPRFMMDVLVQYPDATSFLHWSLQRDPSFQARILEAQGSFNGSTQANNVPAGEP